MKTNDTTKPDAPLLPLLMMCGCVAQAINRETGAAVCTTHYPHPNSTTVQMALPDLSGRMSRCCYGDHANVPSKWALPFFVHQPEKERDRHYCGCFGWN